MYGSLTVAGSGEVDVAADGGPSGSQYVYGVNGTDITTSGSIQASVAAYNGDVACGGRPDYAPVLGHTGGSIEFTGETQALTVAPEDVSGFVITGAPEDTYVKYNASAAGDVPVITIDGAEVSGTHSLILQNGVAMEVTIGATCVGGCTVTVDEVNLPAGVTWNSAIGVLSGEPTTSGTSSFTVTAVSNADSGKTASLTVNWTVNNILVLHGAVSSYYETGAVQVKQGKMYSGVFLPVVGETPDSRVITVGGEIVTAEYSGGTFWCYPSQGVGENYQTSTLYRFYYDASEAEVGTTVPVSVMPQKGGSDMLAAPVAFDLKVVPANTPDYLLIDNSSYYNPGVNDYDYLESQGWKWTAADQVLRLKGYNGRRIAADNGDLTLKLSNGADNVITVTGSSTALTADNLTIQDYVGKLKINCGSDGTAICTDSLTVNAGQLYVTMDEAAEDMWITRNASAEKTLNIGGGTDFKVVLLQGKGADDITVNIDVGVTQYYTHTGSDPDLYLFGNVNPEVAIAVSGDDTVSESKDAVLTASVPAWVTGAVTQDGDPAFGLSYQWQYNNAGTWTGLSGETGSTLVLTPADVNAEGTIGASRAYRYLMSLTYQGTTSITSSSHTVTIASAGVAVTGQVKGYHSGNAPVVQLYAAGDMERTTPLATAALGTAEAGGSQYIWSFTFDAVASGTYDLVVTKAGHLAYTVKGVTVGAEDLDLTASSSAAVKLISLLAGDMNGDAASTSAT